jgi:hypothetical protein
MGPNGMNYVCVIENGAKQVLRSWWEESLTPARQSEMFAGMIDASRCINQPVTRTPSLIAKKMLNLDHSALNSTLIDTLLSILPTDKEMHDDMLPIVVLKRRTAMLPH